jgi:hypothetical protein
VETVWACMTEPTNKQESINKQTLARLMVNKVASSIPREGETWFAYSGPRKQLDRNTGMRTLTETLTLGVR